METVEVGVLQMRRQRLDGLLRVRDLAGVITEFPEIKVIEEKEERPEGERCIQYALEDERSPALALTALITQGQEVAIPGEGDFVLYRDKESNFRHIGKYKSDGRVVSNVGGDVIEHPVSLVPTYYGTNIVFLRKPVDGLKY